MPCQGGLAQGSSAGATSRREGALAPGHGQRVALAQAQRARAAVDLDQRLGERVGVLARLVGGVDHAHDAVLVLEQEGRRVLAADPRSDARGPAGEPADLAEQEARDVEEMDHEVEDDEALLEGEVGLVGVDVVAGAPGDPGEEGLADRALLEHLPNRAERGLETEVLVHHQRHAGLGAGLDHRPAVVDRRREGLLHDDRDALRGRELDEAAVARHGGDHVDEVGPLGLEHRPGVGVPARGPERAAAAAALDSSRSQTAASSTASMARQACRWFCAKKPQPITAPLSLSIGHPRSPTHAAAQPSRAGAARKRSPCGRVARSATSSPMMDLTKSRGGDR